MIWPKASVNSDWVLDEADAAKRRNVLIPVLINAIDSP
jgi:hypothetical protein